MVGKITKHYYLYRAGKLDQDSFAKVYDLYIEKIYRFIYFKVSSVEEARDIAAEVFLKTWEYIKKRESGIENLEALLYRVARNLVVDFYRKKSRCDLINLESVSERDVVGKRRKDIHQQLDVKLRTQKVLEALDKLNDLYREIIILRYLDQFSINEIASIIGKSKGATRVLVHRALAVLKKILEKKT